MYSVLVLAYSTYRGTDRNLGVDHSAVDCLGMATHMFTSSSRRFHTRPPEHNTVVLLNPDQPVALRGPTIPRATRMRDPVPPTSASPHYTHEHDAATWMRNARTISKLPRSDTAKPPSYPKTNDDGESPQASAAGLAQPPARDTGHSQLAASSAFRSQVPRLRSPSAGQPESPGPGHVNMTDPSWSDPWAVADPWPSHGQTDRPRPTSMFVVSPRATGVAVNPRVGPGSYNPLFVSQSTKCFQRSFKAPMRPGIALSSQGPVNRAAEVNMWLRPASSSWACGTPRFEQQCAGAPSLLNRSDAISAKSLRGFLSTRVGTTIRNELPKNLEAVRRRAAKAGVSHGKIERAGDDREALVKLIIREALARGLVPQQQPPASAGGALGKSRGETMDDAEQQHSAELDALETAHLLARLSQNAMQRVGTPRQRRAQSSKSSRLSQGMRSQQA